MKSMNKLGLSILTFVGISLALGGCATNRAKTFAAMAGAGLAGGIVGSMTAPANESSVAHGLLWGSVSAAVAGVAGLLIFDEQARSNEFEHRALRAEAEVREFKSETDRKLVAEGIGAGTKNLPLELRGLVLPDGWKLYSQDKWVEDSDGHLVHQIQELEFQPGALVPGFGAKVSKLGGAVEAQEKK